MTESAGSFSSSALKTGPSMSLIDTSKHQGNVGVGTYKGVMLCNRPFGGTDGTNNIYYLFVYYGCHQYIIIIIF